MYLKVQLDDLIMNEALCGPAKITASVSAGDSQTKYIPTDLFHLHSENILALVRFGPARNWYVAQKGEYFPSTLPTELARTPCPYPATGTARISTIKAFEIQRLKCSK